MDLELSADVYDALISKRPYKEPFSHEGAMDIILKGDSRTRPDQFDPVVLNALSAGNRTVKRIAVQSAD